MRYLSQAMIPLAAALKAALVDGYAWHQAIWKAFPDRPDDARDFLFRVDRKDGGFRVLLLSEEKPQPEAWFAWQTKEVGLSFLSRTAYHFQVRANPTMRRSADKRRLAIYDESRLREWLSRKAEASGFEVDPDTLTIGAPRDETFRKDGKFGKHVTVDFEGILRVTDHDRFAQAFNSGIGSAKGFGYGLLMLQPLH